MAVTDLRGIGGVNGGIEVCYLAEDAKRITAPNFKVWVPSIMGGIDKQKTEYQEKIGAKQDVQDNAAPANPVQCQGYLLARSVTPYHHRLDGWIPFFQIERMTMETGSMENTQGQMTGKIEPCSHNPGGHPLVGDHTYDNVKMQKIEYKDIRCWTSTGVDFQELHNTVIKRGHKMYGCFANGEQNQFIILAIDQVTPYLDMTENGNNQDNEDTHQGQFQNVENE